MSVSGASEVSDTEVSTEEQDSTAEVSQLSETEDGGSQTPENETTTGNSELDEDGENEEIVKETDILREMSTSNANMLELTRPESMTFAPTFDEYGEDGPLALTRGSQFEKNARQKRSSNFQDYDELYGELGYDSGEDEEMETVEELLDYQNHKQRLINRYINTKGIYKYFTKKNAFLQDKLYKICVRKSFIVENKGGQEEEKQSKYHRRRKRLSTSAGLSSKVHRDRTESGEMDEDVVETEELPEDNKSDKFPRITAFLEAALESKYRRVVQAILAAEKSKDDDAAVWDTDLIRLREKNERVEETHLERVSSLMERIKNVSEIATDSNTGRRIPRWETDQYIEEVTRIHQKFVQTLTRLYQNRHGLVFALQRLQETEFQGEGLQMLEYEQLQAENYSLKDKLEDRQKDLDHIKEKIAHAVQILAHFRECMSKLKEKLEAGTNKLDHINGRVYQVKQKTDEVTQRYEAVKAEESTLVQESGLLDNIRLLRDFEKTHYSNLKTRESKRNLKKKIAYRARETRTLQTQIKDIAIRLPQLQQAEVPSTAPAFDSNVSQTDTEPNDDEVAWNAQLQWLLNQRCQDPLFSSAETCSAKRAGKLWQSAANHKRLQPYNTVY